MKINFNLTGLDWEGLGYFGCPDRPTGLELPADKITDPWSLWIIAFHRSKLGDFTYLSALTTSLKNSADWLLVTTCSDLLGDAGTEGCFESLLEGLREVRDFPRAREICRALYLRGKLSDVPMLVNVYENFSSIKEAEIIPVWIADLLEKEDGLISEPTHFEDEEDYCDAVMNSYWQLIDELGSDQVFVFNGVRFSVTTLGQHIIERVRQPFVRSTLRQKFEASTGINCTKFYRGGELQPLSTAAIVEKFLESPEAEKYEDGVRYFFGHRIPD